MREILRAVISEIIFCTVLRSSDDGQTGVNWVLGKLIKYFKMKHCYNFCIFMNCFLQ